MGRAWVYNFLPRPVAIPKAIRRSNCINPEGINSPCDVSIIPNVVAFGVVELFLSQIPSFHQIWLLSIVSATMSLIFPSIVIGLGIEKVVEAGEIKGSLSGIRIGSVTESEKIFSSFRAAGSIAFSSSFSLVLFEIQDTIELLQHTIDSPPSEDNRMKRAIHWSIIIAAIFRMLCGCVGYAAFGDLSPANLLTGFGSYSSRNWLLDIANVAIVIHRIGAYQVFCQPIFAFIEKTASDRFPNSTFINQEIQVLRTTYRLNLFKFVSRCIFVIITTIISMFDAPFFSDGVLDAIGLWRLTFHLHVAMHIAQDEVPQWSKKWVQILSVACLVISVAAPIGSFVGLFF